MLNFEIEKFSKCKDFLKDFSKRRLVILSLFCGEITYNSVANPTLYGLTKLCLKLTQKWLNGVGYSQTSAKKTVTKIYSYASTSSIFNTYPALNALRLVLSDNHGISHYYASHSIYYALLINKSFRSKILPYMDALTKNIPKTPYSDPLEIIVYLQDQLEYPILDGNRLNLWDKDYDYQVIGTIEEIANTVGVKNLLNSGD